MSKLTYCSNCGFRLTIHKKALPKYGRIVDLIEPHECSEEPHEFDLAPTNVPTYQPEEKNNKFVKKLNGLSPPSSEFTNFPAIDINFKDRRPADQVKSTAPESLLTHMKDAINTSPAHELTDPDTITNPEPE